MSDVSAKSDDLKTLQREAAELQESRKRKGSTKTGKPQESPQTGTSKDTEKKPVDTPTSVSSEGENRDISDQLEMYLRELEETALERPVLALLATFSLGVIVGHLFTRK
jgi:hypothetical protein